ncbi:hypothetical protein B0A49_02458 [Cryomyces minteri]|uniref:Indoleamine 2,3-dioxygenase n=1 Tax=Cryomyces minteri TaxID=331657 RepID=A0A4U0XM20_9PEZI|nr:hypothetical protein B0A49_02458 [Cryomyces minteri]
MAVYPNSSASAPTFPILHSTPPDSTLPAFLVSTNRGFLPRNDPITVLPSPFQALEDLLQRMPIKTADGSPGLLATGSLGEAVKSLPDLTEEVERVKNDLPLMNALYRDYSFLTSAYLLEPCHMSSLRGEGYGLAREVLPANIARPIARVAELAGFKPFMEYAGSYALYNFRLEDPTKGLEYSNLRLIRAFENGLDPASSEAGFVLVHVDMVANSGPLVAGVEQTLAAAAAKDRDTFDEGMAAVVTALKRVNAVMNGMWSHSKPKEYTSFRTFIFGIAGQSMFPHGVIYEGVSEKPMTFRGESGANDSMIPLVDNLLSIPMPSTPLTAILHDFRAYRPGNHREFLEWVAARSASVDMYGFAMQDSRSAALYLRAVDQWLPNQLQAVLNLMNTVADRFEHLPGCDDIMDVAKIQQHTLRKEVEKYCQERDVEV